MGNMNLKEIEAIHKTHLNVSEVSKILGISRHTFYKYSETFPFPVVKVGKRLKIPKHPFVDYLKTGGWANLKKNDGEGADTGENEGEDGC